MIKINCDLCGKVEERLCRAIIEDVELNVCNKCSKFGKVLGPVKKQLIETNKTAKNELPQEENIELIVDNYASLIKEKREVMGLTQKEFANRLNEKESVIHKIESGAWQPDLTLARKLEKMFDIKLVQEHLENHLAIKKRNEEGFTLGDFIKIKN